MPSKRGNIFRQELILHNNIQAEIRRAYIKQIRKAIENDNFTIKDREKNNKFIRKYRLKTAEQKSLLLQISLENCIEGPVKSIHQEFESKIFKFKVKFKENIIVYIKVELDLNSHVICISFHEDEKRKDKK